MSQTGGGCRASNYIHLLRKALVNAGMGHIPVISVNLSGMEKNPGFSFTLPMLRQAFAALIFGDCLTLLNNQTKPYEINYGESENLVASWVKTICGLFEKGGDADQEGDGQEFGQWEPGDGDFDAAVAQDRECACRAQGGSGC